MHGHAQTATYEAWDFNPSGEVLAMTTIRDLNRDSVDELVVAALDRSVYAVDGATGEKLWNYTASEYYRWEALVAWPSVDANGNSRPDVLVASDRRLVVMMDGGTGKPLWSFSTTDSGYNQGAACSVSVRSAHFISDVDGDGVADSAIVSGTGDTCSQKDRIDVIALSSKTGQELWEYSSREDYRGLKDGIDGASPATVLDFNKDGILDVAIADEESELRVINGKTGNELRSNSIGVFGSIWDFTELPDISGDGIPDVLAFEFIEGGGGPDYASIDAIDLVGSRVLWQIKVGDGRINGGALFSAASLNGTEVGGTVPVSQVAVTMRTENELTLVLLDSKTGQQKWQYRLGEERSRDDLNKVYPVARIGTSGVKDELALGSIDSKLYLLNILDGTVIWSHAVTGEIGGMVFAAAPNGQKYIIVEDSYLGVRALSRQTTISTTLSIESSSQTLVLSSKVVISGTLDPNFPGELVQLRYVDPTGAVSNKQLIMSREGTYSDLFEPTIVGTWKVSAEFIGEGMYVGSKSPTISFTVVDETEILVYRLEVPDDPVSYPINYFVDGGQVDSMSIDKDAKALKIRIAPTGDDGSFNIELPRTVIDSFQTDYRVYVDGTEVQYQETGADASARSLAIPFDQDAREITIAGTFVVPEFRFIAPLLAAITMIAVVVVAATRNKLDLKI